MTKKIKIIFIWVGYNFDFLLNVDSQSVKMSFRIGVDGTFVFRGRRGNIVAQECTPTIVRNKGEPYFDEYFIKFHIHMRDIYSPETEEKAKNFSKQYFKTEAYWQDLIQGFYIQWQ